MKSGIQSNMLMANNYIPQDKISLIVQSNFWCDILIIIRLSNR
jgi:hypothetical protein